MSKYYDRIATVDIDLQTPIVDGTSFDNLLIVGPLPAGGGNPPQVGAYSSLEEVSDAGWTVTGDGADPVGLAAAVAFAQSPGPKVIYIAPIQITEGTAEPAAATVARAVGTDGWYVVCTAGVDKSEYEAIAAYVETQEKLFLYTELDFFSAGTGGANAPSVGTVYYRSMGIYGRQSTAQADRDIPPANRYLNVAFAAKWLAYDSGSETSAFKQLAAVYPAELSSTEYLALSAANLNCFVTMGSRDLTMNGKVMAGEWADVIRFRDYLKNDMQVRVANLFVTNPKIPYTDSGIALVENQMRAALRAGQNAGGVAETEFDENGDPIPGFETSVPLAANLTASQRASRKLTGCRFKARLAGAIHFAELTGSLTYTM